MSSELTLRKINVDGKKLVTIRCYQMLVPNGYNLFILESLHFNNIGDYSDSDIQTRKIAVKCYFAEVKLETNGVGHGQSLLWNFDIIKM